MVSMIEDNHLLTGCAGDRVRQGKIVKGSSLVSKAKSVCFLKITLGGK